MSGDRFIGIDASIIVTNVRPLALEFVLLEISGPSADHFNFVFHC